MNRINKIATAVYKIVGVWMILGGIAEIIFQHPPNPVAYGFCLLLLGWVSFHMKATIGSGDL